MISMGKIRRFINKIQVKWGVEPHVELSASAIKNWDGLLACVESHRELKEAFA